MNLLDPYFTLYTKTNSKCTIPNIRTKTVKLLEEKIDNDFLDLTQKVYIKKEKADKLDFINIKNYFQRTPLRK